MSFEIMEEGVIVGEVRFYQDRIPDAIKDGESYLIEHYPPARRMVNPPPRFKISHVEIEKEEDTTESSKSVDWDLLDVYATLTEPQVKLLKLFVQFAKANPELV